MIEIMEYGLKKSFKAKWQGRDSGKVDICFQSITNPPQRSRLTLKQMGSAFLFLAAGYGLSLLVFMGEKIAYRFKI